MARPPMQYAPRPLGGHRNLGIRLARSRRVARSIALTPARQLAPYFRGLAAVSEYAWYGAGITRGHAGSSTHAMFASGPIQCWMAIGSGLAS
eukprot:5048289-Prymnesium_polylepis.1